MMKSPLWILNSTFAAILCGVTLTLILYRPKSVPRSSLQPQNALQMRDTDTITPVDLARIYEHDPFGTLSSPKPPEQPLTPPPAVAPVPASPQLRRNSLPAPTIPTFLPPLGVTLKGIMHSLHEDDNRAIIADKKSKQEHMYKVGDSILDAEIIRIESNQVMFMRSNGQQEVLFITPSEAQADPFYTRLENTRTAPNPVKKVDAHHYLVDPILFMNYSTNMAQFIDALDITTAVEQSVGIGCRIGTLQPYSIGTLLGLQAGDIITTINGIPTATTSQRLAIYQQIRALANNDTIQVELRRGIPATQIVLTYTIQSFSAAPPPAPGAPTTNKQNNSQQIPGRIQANPAEKLHKDNKNAMLKQGGKPTTLRSSRL